jgi:hypothetical protein
MYQSPKNDGKITPIAISVLHANTMFRATTGLARQKPRRNRTRLRADQSLIRYSYSVSSGYVQRVTRLADRTHGCWVDFVTAIAVNETRTRTERYEATPA